MEEINIIKQQLKKLQKKGIALDIVNDTIVLVDIKKQADAITKYDASTNKWDGLSKDHINFDKFDTSKYIITSL